MRDYSQKAAKKSALKKPSKRRKKPAKLWKAKRRVEIKKPLIGHFAVWIKEEVEAGRMRLCGCPEKFSGIDCPLCHGTGIAWINKAWPLIVDYVENHTRPMKVSDLVMGLM